MKHTILMLVIGLLGCCSSPPKRYQPPKRYLLHDGTIVACKNHFIDPCGLALWNCKNHHTYYCQQNVVRER